MSAFCSKTRDSVRQNACSLRFGAYDPGFVTQRKCDNTWQQCQMNSNHSTPIESPKQQPALQKYTLGGYHMAKNKEYADEEMTVELELEDGTLVTCAIVTILTVESKD